MASPFASAGTGDPRSPTRNLWHSAREAASSSDRRARPDSALAVDQRPQSRRRLPRPPWTLSILEGGTGRAIYEIEEAIRPGGISRIKSARIRSILQAITDTAPAHALSLDWLAELTALEAQRYLTSLPGVGRKTAACVLLFALGMRDVPVDTHVARVGTRLALFRPGAGFTELHDTMLAITPRGQELELHLNLLRHGRRTCYARRPDCAGCALNRMCPSAFTFG
jgi:endonuclease III